MRSPSFSFSLLSSLVVSAALAASAAGSSNQNLALQQLKSKIADPDLGVITGGAEAAPSGTTAALYT